MLMGLLFIIATSGFLITPTEGMVIGRENSGIIIKSKYDITRKSLQLIPSTSEYFSPMYKEMYYNTNKNIDEININMFKNYQNKQAKYIKNLNIDTQIAIESYTGIFYYKYVNTILRLVENVATTKYIAYTVYDSIQYLYDAIYNMPKSDEDIYYYRGVLDSTDINLGYIDVKVGDVIIEPGFVSMSRNKEITEIFMGSYNSDQKKILLIIKMPKGSKALDISSISETKTEEESLALPGSTFRVIEIINNDDIKTLIVEYIDNIYNKVDFKDTLKKLKNIQKKHEKEYEKENIELDKKVKLFYENYKKEIDRKLYIKKYNEYKRIAMIAINSFIPINVAIILYRIFKMKTKIK
jgi:hypothetical protein